MEITLDKLEANKACGQGLFWFSERFPEGAEHTEIISRLEEEKTTTDWIEWLLKEFKLSGIARSWHPNGQLAYEWSYENGELHGESRDWYPNGQLKYEWVYENGEVHGIQRGWHPNGKLGYEQTYNHGFLI